MAKRRNLHVDLVIARGRVEPLAKCPMCPAKIHKDDAVVRVRNFDDMNDPPVTIHRRCLEALLVDGVEDVPRMKSKVERYVDGLIRDKGLRRIG